MKNDIQDNYYIKNKSKILKKFDKILKSTKLIFNIYFNNSEIDGIIKDCRNEFEQLLPNLPYIGGEKNRFTFNLIATAFMLGVIKILEAKKFSQEEIGKILYDGRELFITSISKPMKWVFKRLFFSKHFLKKLKKQAIKSKERKYSEDWVLDVIEGNGVDFDFGYNITECAICKYCKKMGYEAYLPYLCLSDYASFRGLGIGFIRTQTISNSAPICDFRFKKGYQTPRGWPPDNIIEFNKKE